jgi:hypothetical protein
MAKKYAQEDKQLDLTINHSHKRERGERIMHLNVCDRICIYVFIYLSVVSC